jgi:ATP-binding cassette subfamily B protein
MVEKSKVSNLMLLLKYLADFKLNIFGVLISIIFTSSSVLTLGRGLKYLIDEGFGNKDPYFLDKTLGILLCAIILLAIASYFRSYLMNSVSEKIIAKIRTEVYSHVIKLSPSYFETTRTSDIVSRLNTDTTLLINILPNAISFFIRNFITVLGGVWLTYITSPKLTAYLVIIVPASLIPIIFIGRRVRGLSRSTQEKIADIGAHTEESINAIKTVQAYNLEEYESNIFAMRVSVALKAANNRIRMRALLISSVISIVFASIAWVLWIGGHDVLGGNMTAGNLSAFIFYAIIVATSIGALSEGIGELQRAAGATERLFEVLNSNTDIVELSSSTYLPSNYSNDIVFEDISFNYPTRPEVASIEGFNLTINQGEKLAIIGKSGAGKTTLFQLLLRFYDPSKGKITLGGLPINQLRLQELRNQFAVVSQEPVIFSLSAYDNIKLGRVDAKREEIIEAAKMAEIYDFLECLPQGINTFLGEKGVSISGGQRQRIAIARAILRNPRILLLDEATSHLDIENEILVQRAIDRLMQGRTTIIISHNLPTILNADRIVVLNKGKIEAIGSHQELVGNNELYTKLVTQLEE